MAPLQSILRTHWEKYRKYNFECGKKWSELVPPSVTENENEKIMYTTTILIDKRLENNRPDCTVVNIF